MDNYRFSVWTATYNRARFLNRLYESLLSQTFSDFEWIIIDDGSTDDTKKLIKAFQEENRLKSIKYHYKSNGGKHTAWRKVSNMFKGKYVITIDSDDTLTPNALEVFDYHWSELEKCRSYQVFWEVKGRCQLQSEELIGKPLPTPVFDSNTDEMAFKLKYRAEMHACRKKEVLLDEAKVPEEFIFENKCSNFSESIRWSRAGRKYKTRYVDEVVRTYYFDAEDSLTSKKRVSEKTLYNSLVQTIYALQERSDVMIRWDIPAYLKTIVIFFSCCFSLKTYPFGLVKINRFERVFLGLMLGPSFLYWVLYRNYNKV